MLLWVKDDGYGMDSDKLERIRNMLDDANGSKAANGAENKSSIGLENVNQRIKLMYGKDYGVSIESSRGIGTRVEIRIPKDRGGN
jgi:two-component system sensor histidine kinase YesM